MRKRICGLLFLFVSSVLPAQNVQWYIGKPIENISFEGLQNVPMQRLEPVLMPFIGQTFTDDLFLDLQTKLYALDYFDEFYANAVSADGSEEKVTIVFVVVERPIIDRIVIKGNTKLRESDIMAELLSKPEEPYKKAKVRMDRNSIQVLYRDKGYPDVKVEATSVRSQSTNRTTLVFEIEEGNQLVIGKIEFEGVTLFSETSLKLRLDSKEKSVFAEGLFSDETLETDCEKLVSMYRERGYIEAAVTSVDRTITFNPDRKRNEIALKFHVHEGFQYVMGDVSVYGNRLYTAEEILKYFTIKKGEILNFNRIALSHAAVGDLYYNDGFIFNQIELIDEIDRDSLSVNYRIEIVERMRAHIEKITVRGNEKTSREVILRELPFEEGDVFSKFNIMHGLRNLYGLGYFDKIDIETPQGTADGLMELVIIVQENQNKDIRFGLNFSGSVYESPIQLFVQWNDNNFLGKGYGFGVSTNLSTTTQNLTLNFSDSWLGGERVYLGGYIGFEHSTRGRILQDLRSPSDTGVPDPYEGYYVYKYDVYEGDNVIHRAGEVYGGVPTRDEIDEYDLVTDYEYARFMNFPIDEDFFMHYESFNFNFGLNVGYTWATHIGRFSISSGPGFMLEYIDYDETLYRPYSQYLRDNLREAVFNNRWTSTFAWDFRDNINTPNQGFYIKETLSYVGGLMLGNVHYVKSRTHFEGYIRLFDIPVKENVWNYKTILKTKSSFAVILPQYMYDKASKTWRNSTEADLTTNDLLFTDGMNTMLGWDVETDLYATWQNYIALQMPLYEQYVWAELFFEATGIWDNLSDLIPRKKKDGRSSLEDHFYYTIGAGLRLTIPGLPIGFYLARRFRVLNGEVIWQEGNGFNGKLDYILSFNYEY